MSCYCFQCISSGPEVAYSIHAGVLFETGDDLFGETRKSRSVSKANGYITDIQARVIEEDAERCAAFRPQSWTTLQQVYRRRPDNRRNVPAPFLDVSPNSPRTFCLPGHTSKRHEPQVLDGLKHFLISCTAASGSASPTKERMTSLTCSESPTLS